MKLQDCHLAARTVLTAPFERDSPEPDWEEAQAAGCIPPELWDFYRAASYLSVSKLAGYLTTEEKIITVYFSRLVRGIKDSLVDSAGLRTRMAHLYPKHYNPLRPSTEVDRNVAPLYRAAFRSLLGSLVGALDVFADAAAVMLPRAIPAVRAGAARFTHVENWLRQPHPQQVGLLTPAAHFAALLHERLAPAVVVTSGPECDWLRLMRMYRNKSAHLGLESYPEVGLMNKTGGISLFMPRSWPAVPEQYAVVGSLAPPTDGLVDFSDVLSDWLVHQDIEEYSQGAYLKIKKVIDLGFGVLRQAYVQVGRVPLDLQTLADLERSRESYKFEFFEASD